MNKLDNLLMGEEPEERQRKPKNLGFDELHISEEAYAKAFEYARIIIKRTKKNVEIGGFLTTPKDSEDRVARDAFLARDQVVREGFYELDAESVLKAKKELDEKGQKILGWWHSHGRFQTFHSGTDVENQMRLLNQIAPSNYEIRQEEREYSGLTTRIEGNKLILENPENPRERFELDIKGDAPDIAIDKLRLIREKRIGFSYSFVVNHHRWTIYRKPYCEIATRDLCSDCMETRDKSVVVPYKIFKQGEFELDEDELGEEIKERVHLYNKPGRVFLPENWRQRGQPGSELIDPSKVSVRRTSSDFSSSDDTLRKAYGIEPGDLGQTGYSGSWKDDHTDTSEGGGIK